MPVEIRMLCGHRFAVSEADSTKDMRCPFCKDKPALASLSPRDEALEAAILALRNVHCDEERFGDECGIWNSAIESGIKAIRALRSPAEQNAAPQKDGHSERMPQRDGPADTLRACGNPPVGAAPDRSPIHTPTEDCGFDRNGSHNAGHYVCMCGWEDTHGATPDRSPAEQNADRFIGDPPGTVSTDSVAPDRSPGGGASDPDKVICPNCCHQFAAIPENTQEALRRPAPPAGMVMVPREPTAAMLAAGTRVMVANGKPLWVTFADNALTSTDLALAYKAMLAASPEAGGRG